MASIVPASLASLPGVWQGRHLRCAIPVVATGHAVLDRRLPAGGWPLGALTELLGDAPGAGEVSLLLPALARLTASSQWVVWVDPPWVPYPPAMRGHGLDLERMLVVRTRSAHESLWACEQALRGVRGGAVLAWPQGVSFARLRRLQLAADAGRKAAFLFRAREVAAEASPAALRLWLEADVRGTRVTVLKCRGRRPEESILVRRSVAMPGGRLLIEGDPSVSIEAAPPGKPEVVAPAHVH